MGERIDTEKLKYLVKSHTWQNSRGFSLIEIISVLLLLSIIAVVTVINLPASNASLVAEADRLSSHLRYAQIRAQADTYQWRLFFTSASTYQIGPVIVPGAGFTPGIIPGTGMTQNLTDGIIATGASVIRFDSWGRPLNAAGALLGTDQTISLTQGANSRSIIIRESTGFIP